MTTQDLSRAAFDPRKHYSSVRMQQGRVLVDDDWNEAETIAEERDRRATVDIVGPVGTPDDGFRIADPTLAAGRYDFLISTGTFYLGGRRLEMEQDELFLLQRDLLAVSAEEPQVPTAERFDLVYLTSYEQTVSAVEDGELFEVALGGPDSAARVRAMRRVHVRAGITGQDCAAAWQALLAEWEAAGLGTLDAQHALVRDATLQVTYAPGTDANDLCAPVVQGGYLGAENQAIRVQLVDDTHFTWGFDNASPLYRVLVTGGDTITLLTEPKDQAHWPLAGDTVEILPWGAVLPNGEKIAELVGHLSLVQDSFDPDSGELTLLDAVPAGFGEEWQDRGDRPALEADGVFYYMRVWHRGSARGGDAAVAFIAGDVVELGHTGIEVTIEGTELATGDYWIIAARPATPRRVVPWALESGRAPHGTRVYAAPLALIHWAPDSNGVIVPIDVHDCRTRFRPLTRLNGCCTYRVGDGVRSHGDYRSIQQAIGNLPPSGGEICILPGVYEEQVVIERRTAITIKGCGRRTILRAPPDAVGAVLTIRDAQDISVRGLRIEAPEHIGIFLETTDEADKELEGLQRIRLRHLDLAARDQSAVHGRGCRDLWLTESRITADVLAEPLTAGSDVGRWPAVFLAGTDLRIESNRIACEAGDTAIETAVGGVQIGGGSERVRIQRNRIAQGNGNGITLGEVVYVPLAYVTAVLSGAEVADVRFVFMAWGHDLSIGDAGCVEVGEEPEPPTGDDGNPLVPVSGGALRDIEIIGNEIERMGSNGIAVARFFDLVKRPVLITVHRLTIAGNTIRRCLRNEQSARLAGARDHIGFGGITLADGESVRIEGNVIAENGLVPLDPACGVFVLRSEGIAIDHNRILENGTRGDTAATPKPGHRGGIVLPHARPRAIALELGPDFDLTRGDGVPAVRVHDNIVVSPVGEALLVRGLGAMSVQDNHFTARATVLGDLFALLAGAAVAARASFGVTVDGGVLAAASTPRRSSAAVNAASGAVAAASTIQNLVRGAVVTVLDLSISLEERAIQGLRRSPGLGGVALTNSTLSGVAPFGLVNARLDGAESMLTNGNVLFNDNQVVFDAADAGFSFALASMMVFSRDDVGALGNQCESLLTDDMVLVGGIFFGWSVRVVGNRFKETPGRALRSAATVGFTMNCTDRNQGTHCFRVLGPSLTKVASGNRSLIQLFVPQACEDQNGEL